MTSRGLSARTIAAGDSPPTVGPPLKRDDHDKRAWVKSLYHVDIDDLRLFSLVLDASRFSPDRLVEAMLAAGGVESARLATELAG
jgi:hypothetical protein